MSGFTDLHFQRDAAFAEFSTQAQTAQVGFYLYLFNLLYPNISRHILHTVLFVLPMILTRRICLIIKSFTDFFFIIFFIVMTLCGIQQRYCREKLHASQPLGLNSKCSCSWTSLLSGRGHK